MNGIRHCLVKLLVWLSFTTLASCGGGNGGQQPEAKPVANNQTLGLFSVSMPDQTVAVPTSITWTYMFDAFLSAEGLSTLIQLQDGQGPVAVDFDILDGRLRVRPVQPLKMRTSYTLTVKAGVKAINGAVLKTDVVRRFKTVLLDGVAQTVQPRVSDLTNYRGQHTFRIGDVNGDGRPDLVQIGGDAALANERNSFAVKIILQNADHSFREAQNLLIHETQHGYDNSMGDIDIVDVDLDGVPEILIGIVRPSPLENGLMVLKQTSNGQYAVSEFIATNFAYRLLPADIDHDGHLDTLLIGQGWAMTVGPDTCGMVALLSSAGGAQLQSPTILPCESYEAVLGSLEKAGQLELVLLQSAYSHSQPVQSFQQRFKIYTLNAQGHPTLNNELMAAAKTVCTNHLNCANLKLMDADGNGIQDLLFLDAYLESGGTPPSVVYTRTEGNSYKEFGREMLSAYGNLIADMDGDGKDDVVSILQSFLSGTWVATAFTWHPSGFELSHMVPAGVVFDTMNKYTVGIADMDGDGTPDVVMSSYNSGFVVWRQIGPK